MKKIVEQSKQEENITFDDLSKDIPHYEEINNLEDFTLLNYTDKIAHNEEITTQTCIKYTKFQKSLHVKNLLQIIKKITQKITIKNYI